MTSNPMINSRVVENVVLDCAPMSISGAINKTLILVGIVVICAYLTWNLCAGGFSDKALLLCGFGVIAGLILAIVASFKPHTSPITAPLYAACEGLAVGAISYSYAAAYGGIVINAIAITFITLLTMLMLYKSRILQASPTFRKVIFTATIGIMVFYFAGFIGALLGHPMTVFNGGVAGIVISALICGVAAFNFILDFDFIERGAQQNLPSYFEWYGGFALLVTVIWLYLEILRLLAQLNRK